MSISKVKNYNLEPYYDDFDENNNYLRIMFRPGVSVQARELTQLQTALQAQIDKLGQYNFQDGSRVLGGKTTLNINFDYIKLEDSVASFVNEFAGTTITGGTTGVTAEVIKAIAATATDPATLYLKYTSSGTDNQTQTFSAGEVITSDADIVRTGTIGGGVGSTILTPVGQGSSVDIEEGVYFIAGNMVHVPKGNLILDKYTNTPTYIVGLQIAETLVTSADDIDLVDNALGTPNASAPGAHRYSISTTLIKENISLASRAVDDYILLMTIKGGVIQKLSGDALDTELTARLARRTKEESGDYALSPFMLDIKEHLNDNAGNNGFLTAAQGGNDDKLAIGVEPSIAYIQGYRVEKIATEYLELDKPRAASDKAVQTAVTTSTGFGNYIKLTTASMIGIPDINDYTTIELLNSSNAGIGTARARGIEHDSFGTPTFRLYLFDVLMSSGEVFGDVAKVSQTSSGFSADLASVGSRFEVGNSSLVFKLPFNAIETLMTGNDHSADYAVRIKRTGGTVAGGSANFTLPSGTTLQNDDDIVLFASGTTIPIADSQVSGVGTSTVTITGLATYNGQTPVAVFNIAKNNVLPRTKTLRSNISRTIAFVQGTTTYDLGRYDIIKINSVTDSNGTDVTNRFILDDGQRESFYQNGTVTIVGGTTLPAGNFIVNIDHFDHNQGDYFNVNSYPVYDDIPTFNSDSGVLQLRDCVDFRPTKAYAGATAGQEFSSGDNPSRGDSIQPVGVITTDITFYLARIDKLFLSKDGTYRIIKGASSLFPTEPDNIEESLHLSTFYINPYVFRPSDVRLINVDNKRYTMRDIGKLDKRLKNLEYYTSLSLLEKSASDTQLFDGSGFSRFKNGFVVDGFYGHNVGDVSHPDYNCSVDKSLGVLRPKFDERSVNLVRKTGDTGTAVIHAGGVVTMPYTEVTEIDQPYSSYAEFVNPYNVVIWDGTIKLSPDSDEWKEVDLLPDIIINDNSLYDQFLAAAEEEGILGTVWNEWQTNWSGTPTVETSAEEIRLRGSEAANLTGTRRGGGMAVVTRTTQTSTFTGDRTRDGMRTSIASDTVFKEVGNVVVEVNFIPFMRARKVAFKAELLKPNTRVYPFFNGTDVSNFCREEAFTEFHAQRDDVVQYTDVTAHPAGATQLITDASGKVEGTFVIPRNSNLRFKTGTREFKLTDSNVNNDGTSTTKASENFYAMGVLETTQRTIVATKMPRLQRTQINDSKTITRNENQTRHDLVRYYDPLAETFVVKTKGGVFTTNVGLFFSQIDDNIPVTVSIRTVENGTPTQNMVPGSEVVVYPSSITTSANASVETQISFDHPIYLQESIEYAIVIMSNSDKYKVYVAETGAYDLTTTTYRITKQPYNGVFFTSQNASTWTPEQTKDLKFKLGRASFTGSSATINLVNDSIPPKKLSPDPLEFLANVTSTTCKIRVNHKNHGMYNPNNASSEHSVTIAGATGTINGVASTLINGTHDVNESELDSYTITIGTVANPAQATTLNVAAGGTAITATENMIYNVLNVAAQMIEFKDATIDYHLQPRSGSCPDPDSGVVNYNNIPEYNILANSNVATPVPYVIASGVNETAQSSGKSFNLRTVLNNSGIENLSPVLDMNRTSAITVMNRVNDATANASQYTGRGTYVADTEPQNTSNVAKYITKRVKLNEEASLLDIYVNVNRPDASNIDIYYKLSDDTTIDFDNTDWVLATPDKIIPINNGNEYTEMHYEVTPGTNESFDSFSVKIVMRSENSSNVPTVKDFRAIATT
jgi:hypothetical protein